MTSGDMFEYIKNAKLTDIENIMKMCESRKRALLAKEILIDEEDVIALRALEEMYGNTVKANIESSKYLREKHKTSLAIARLTYMQWKKDHGKY